MTRIPKGIHPTSQSISTIQKFWREHKRMPSYSEVAKLFGFKSKETAWRMVKQLIASGHIKKDLTGKLIPKTLVETPVSKLRLLGLVEAGFGSPASEEELDRISLDEWLIEDESRSFMLKIKGDSMIDAGIFDGDYCIVEKTSKARVGQIVVAELDGAFTVKYLRHDKQGYYLEPANKAFKALRPTEDLKITALVKAVVRKY